MVGWRDGGLAAALAAYIAATGVVGDAVAQGRPERPIRCGGDVLARAPAGRVIDGRTFVLEDGREVRLAAIEVPPLALPQQTSAAQGAAAAKDALAALVSGAEVVLRRAEVPSDRYGRLVGFASTVRDRLERPAQDELVAGGFARVAAHVGSRDCATELFARERAARAAKLGLWADSTYNLLAADNPADVLAQRGRFALVEGTVISVRESGATIYVNFGRRWTEDFTVTILKRNERKFVAAGLEPKRLAGRLIRVRGWIEERGGPWIEAGYRSRSSLLIGNDGRGNMRRPICG